MIAENFPAGNFLAGTWVETDLVEGSTAPGKRRGADMGAENIAEV